MTRSHRAAIAATLMLSAGCGTVPAPTASSGDERSTAPAPAAITLPVIGLSPTSFHFLV